jgi:ElaB/YqjD/DUF883 family membrane-anchored ribosome-binding protein
MSEAAVNSGNGSLENDHLESSREHVRAAAADVREAAAEAAREVKDRAAEFAGEWKGKARDWQKDAETFIRENPTKSVLAAVGVGFVIGLICRK